MSFERNTKDELSVEVKELDIIGDGVSDIAEATITGCYPQEPNTYLCNNECDLQIFPESGEATIVIRTKDAQRFIKIDAERNKEPIEIAKGEGYCYNVREGGKLIVRIASSPIWYPEQYTTVQFEDKLLT